MNKSAFNHRPVHWLPYTDKEVIEKARKVNMHELEDYSWENKEFKVSVVQDVQSTFVIDLFYRLYKSDTENQKLTIILPNPYAAVYENLAELCNKYGVSCRNLNVFFLNEWADDMGNIAPLDYTASYGRIFQKYFYNGLNPELRPKESNIHYFTNENVEHYSDLVDEIGEGGADVCYSSIGWSGRIASIEPEGEFICESMEDYLKQTTRIVSNHMISIAEDSLLGLFASSGDLAAVPPKSATVGPRDIAHARDHIELQYKTSLDKAVSWQRMVSRLMLFGPVAMEVPASILRMYKGTCYIHEAVAAQFKGKPDMPEEVFSYLKK